MDLNGCEVAAIILMAVLGALGVMRGLAKSLVGFAMLVFSLVVTVLFSGSVAEVFADSATLNAYFGERSEVYLDDIPRRLEEGSIDVPLGELLPIQGELGQEILEGGNEYLAALLQQEEVRSFIVRKITTLALNGLGILATFLLIRLALAMIGAIIKGFFGSGRTGPFDRFLGFSVGAVRGILVIWTAMAVIRIFSFTGIGGQLMALVEESVVLHWLDKHNLVMSVLDNILTQI